MLCIQSFTFNPFQENTYVLFDETKESVVIDPGCCEKREEEQLGTFMQSNGLVVKCVLNTHGHIDHVLGNFFVTQRYEVPLIIGKHDEATLRSAKMAAAVYGLEQYTEVLPDRFLNEGDVFVFGNQQLKVLFLPGHAPGHIGFYHQHDKVLIGGDVLFQGSVGRTDLPGGNFDMLISSIQHKLFSLPDDVVVYPGHGPATTIGEEKISNPFCALTVR